MDDSCEALTKIYRAGNLLKRRIHHLHRFVFGVAQLIKVALAALRLAGYADAAAVPDKLVGELNPLFFGDDGH